MKLDSKEDPARKSVGFTDCKLVAGCLCKKINAEDRDMPHISNFMLWSLFIQSISP